VGDITGAEMKNESKSAQNGSIPKRPVNQNGPDQNGPYIFDMSKTAMARSKTAHSYIQNGPPTCLKRPTK